MNTLISLMTRSAEGAEPEVGEDGVTDEQRQALLG